jgi:hypothetical protein
LVELVNFLEIIKKSTLYLSLSLLFKVIHNTNLSILSPHPLYRQLIDNKTKIGYSNDMTETQFTPDKGDADVAAYENTDLSQLNADDTVASTEKKLEDTLIRVVFFGRIAAYVALGLLLLTSLYGWTRNQKQESWLMSLEFNTAGSPLCTWMNRGYDS